MKKTKLKAVSNKRAKANAEYSRRKKAYLEAHPICQIWLKKLGFGHDEGGYYGSDFSGASVGWMLWKHSAPFSTEIHHSKKPKATYLNDESTWFACCREMHDWVESNKGTARQLGLLQDNH